MLECADAGMTVGEIVFQIEDEGGVGTIPGLWEEVENVVC